MTWVNSIQQWREGSEKPDRIDNHIFNSIDGRLTVDRDLLQHFEMNKEEMEAIKQGFRPDKYYSAAEKMRMAKKGVFIS